MANQADWNSDFDALARQYWAGWNEMMRQAANVQGAQASPFAGMGGMGQGFAMPGFGAPAFGQAPWPGVTSHMGMGGWQDALAQWGRYAQSMGAQQAPDLNATLNDTLGRFQQQAGDWYGRMQQLAGEFSGQAVGAAEIAERWKELLEQNGEGAWLQMFRGMQSPRMHGFDQWYEAVQPMLAGWRNEARGWLGMPTFGLAREHQERLQKMLQAQLDYQETVAAHNAMLSKSAQAAYRNFEKKLAEHESPGLEITSARALFDLWIDAAEDAFADMALSSDYRDIYGAMVNAQMRLRQDVQREIENATGQLGMPTRTEIEAAHRKIAELERIVRRMMRGDAASPSRTANEEAPKRPAPRQRAAKPASKPARKPPAKKAASKKVASKTTGAKKTAASKAARKTVKRSR